MSDSEVSSDGELELSSTYDSDLSSSSSEASSISENGKPKPKSTKVITTGQLPLLSWVKASWADRKVTLYVI
jgi:hypothetical protein